MLTPKRVKFRKVQRGRLKGKAHRGSSISFGTFALQAVESHYITSRQIEAARRAVVRYIRRGGKLWIRVFPDKPWTKRPAETRMGSGKGGVEYYVAPVRPGRILFEMAGIREDQAREALRLAAFKLPMRTQFIAREEHSA
jgi:large subunit ribosomal protein L16